MTFVEQARDTMQTLTQTRGKACTIAREAGATYNPATGIKSGGSTTNHATFCTPPTSFKKENMVGTSVEAGDLVVFVAVTGLTIVPSGLTDKFVMDSETYTIVKVTTGYVGELAAHFKLQLRKGN